MREGDQAEAQRLLAELSNNGSPETRDSALLVQLRSALHAGNSAKRATLSTEQQNRLEGLARDGATASIRADARKLLEEVRAGGE